MIYRFVKRGFDVFNSLLALLLLSPLLLFISIGIKLSSRGPVFYKSERAGQDGKPFTMLKFRSMHIKKEGVRESSYLVNSNRIFGFGAFLRKSKLDELPQLINILRGDMSVVGPRPYPEKAVSRLYAGPYRKVLSVKPGLACLDSLFDYTHGELFVTDETEYAEKILPVRTELALMYVEKKGLGLDLYCVVRTVRLIIGIVLLKKRDFPYTGYEKQAAERVFGAAGKTE